MDVFRKLGEEIEGLWRAENYNEEIFPRLAADALRRANLPSVVSAWDVVEWTLDQTELPRQKDASGKFGEPPITLFVSPRFHIDVYFWLEGTTATHQHGFCGAFQVLLGSSIHSWHGFTRREAVNSFLEIGDMTLKVCELLNVGAVQEIQPGRQYIHSLFHLDQPSATIVVRTDKSPLHLPQFSYHRPFLAVDPFYEHETTSKKLQTITALFRSRHPETDRLISGVLEKSDLHTAFLVLNMVRTWLESNQINNLFNISAPRERFERFMEIVRNVHGEKADALEAAFNRMQRLDAVLHQRRIVTNPEHRFFLALLLNVDGRENILALVKQRFPDADPSEKILDWVFELSETRVAGTSASNALGISGFDAFDMFVFENMFRGRTEDEIRGLIAGDYSGDQATELTAKLPEKMLRINDSVVLNPLIAEA